MHYCPFSSLFAPRTHQSIYDICNYYCYNVQKIWKTALRQWASSVDQNSHGWFSTQTIHLSATPATIDIRLGRFESLDIGQIQWFQHDPTCFTKIWDIWDQYEPPSDHSFSGVYNPYNMVICTFKIWKHPKWVSICPCWWPSLLSFMSIRTEVGIFSPPSPCWQLWVCLSIWAYLKMDYP